MLTAFGGSGFGSVFVRNLTAGNLDYTPVGVLQDLNLMLTAQHVTIDQWDRIDLRTSNVQIDNLSVQWVPEPPTWPILLSTLAVGLWWFLLAQSILASWRTSWRTAATTWRSGRLRATLR